MMAYDMAAALAWLAGLMTRRQELRLGLVLRVENAAALRTSLGPALFNQLLDRLLLRLISELRLLPQPRAPGSAGICGMIAAPNAQMVPGLLAHLQTICGASIDLPELRVCPVVSAVLVADETGDRLPAALYAFGAALLQGGAVSGAGRISHATMPARDLPANVSPAMPAAQVRLRFQPQICCDTGKLLALRVLPYLRVQGSPDCAWAQGQAHLDDAALGLGTESVLRQALAALQGWDRLGLGVPLLSLALSARELDGAGIAETILWELDRLELSPQRLEIEITEPVAAGGPRPPVPVSLKRLAAAGCRIGLGEFGTGSAGLAELRRLGVGRVRIGRDFVAGCDRRGDQQRMILAVLTLAEHLGLATLADGVATADENAFLAQIGFGAVQGPVVAAPLDAADVADFVRDHGRSLPAPFEIRRRA